MKPSARASGSKPDRARMSAALPMPPCSTITAGRRSPAGAGFTTIAVRSAVPATAKRISRAGSCAIDEVAMIAEMTGDGMSWLTTAQFRLSGDGQQLIAPGRLGSEIVRYRCPNAN